MSPTLIVDTKPGDTINRKKCSARSCRGEGQELRGRFAALQTQATSGFPPASSPSLKHARHFQRTSGGMVDDQLPTVRRDYHVPFGGSRGSSYGNREQVCGGGILHPDQDGLFLLVKELLHRNLKGRR